MASSGQEGLGLCLHEAESGVLVGVLVGQSHHRLSVKLDSQRTKSPNKTRQSSEAWLGDRDLIDCAPQLECSRRDRSSLQNGKHRIVNMTATVTDR